MCNEISMRDTIGDKLSVIIVSYNCLDYLQRCIASIWRYNDIGDRLEVIVVDNSSSDETINWLQSECPNVLSVKNDNRGYGQANNVGARLAEGEILLFLNPDTELIEPVFQFALDRFNQDEELGCFGVRLLDENREPSFSYGIRAPFGLLKVILHKTLTRCRVFIQSIMYTSGADIFIKRELFESCGCFDENIFMYSEEADLCNRVNAMGKKVGYYPQKSIIHFFGKTSNFKLMKKYKLDMQAKLYYCEKYGLNTMRQARKERRYCMLKAKLLGMTDRVRSEQYAEIVKIWDEYIESLKRTI